MGKRARRAALMGFVGGVLADVKNRWETKRAQEAEAAKEARLAAIRAEERKQEHALATDRINLNDQLERGRLDDTQAFQSEQTDKTIAAQAARDAANDAAAMKRLQIQESGANTRQGASLAESREARKAGKAPDLSESIMYNPKTGATVVKPAGWTNERFIALHASKGRNLVPYSAGLVPTPLDPMDAAGGQAGAPRAQSFALDFVKYPVTGKPPK